MSSGENIFDRSPSPENASPSLDAVDSSAGVLQVYVLIRWMIRRDMPEVLEIENHSFEFPWSEEVYIRCLRQRDCIGMVAEFEERIVGVMVYELHKTRLHLLNFAIHRDLRRRGIGSAMIAKLQNILSHLGKNSILLEVRETNLPAQLLFKNQGFRAISVLHDVYADTPEDAYLMQYQYQDKKASEIAEESRLSRFAR